MQLVTPNAVPWAVRTVMTICKICFQVSREKSKAEKTESLINKLKDEKEKGIADIPEPIDFKTVEECRAHAADAYKCCKYYLGHRVNADKMDRAASYVMKWAAKSDQVTVVIGEEMAKLMGNQQTIPYVIAYFAGCSKYALDNDSAEFCRDMFVSAMADVLNFYDGGNRDMIGAVPSFDKMIETFKKGGAEALIVLLDEKYKELEDASKKAQNADN